MLAPGATVLLYTDGLIERRSRSLDVGMDDLLREVDARRDCAPQRLADELARALRDPAQTDDVCLLLARLRA